MRGMESKLNEKITTENSSGTIFPPFCEFSNADISKMHPLTDLKFTFPQNLLTYLSNEISNKFGLRWNTKPLLAHGL